MKKLTFLTSIVLLLLFSISAHSQNVKTPYEKRKEALRFKLFSDLGFHIATISSTANVGDFFDEFMLKVKDERGIALLIKYQQDLKNADNLKNANELKKTLRKGEPTQEEILMVNSYSDPKQMPIPDDNTVYSFTEVGASPAYIGGIEKLYTFLADNIKYPEEAKKLNIQGNVYVSFTIEKDGSLADIKVDRKLGYGLDEEAIRVLKEARRWNPGIKNGKPVRVKYHLPVKFSLPK